MSDARCQMLCLALVLTGGCATRVFTPPAGGGTPFPEAAEVWSAATARCRDARVFVAEIRINGWVGSRDTRIAPTMHGAVTRTDDIYMEVPAPFGSPFLQMAGRSGNATLVLPRDRRVLREPAREIVAALTGLRWGARELLDVLSGCAVTPAGDVRGERFGRDVRMTLSPTAHAWVREDGGRWQVRAAQIDGWLVEYRLFQDAWPREVRVTAAGATPVDLKFSLSKVQVNIELPASAFTLTAPEGFDPMSLEELRASGPLREREAALRTGSAPRTPHSAPSTTCVP